MRSHGIEPDKKEVQIVFLGDSPVRLEALKRGIVDATMVFDSSRHTRQQCWVSRSWAMRGRLWSYRLRLGTTDRLLKQKPEQVKRTVRAAIKAILFMRKNKEQSVRIMMSWLALDRDVAEKSYDMALDSFSEDGSPSRKGLMTSIELAGVKENVSPSQSL